MSEIVHKELVYEVVGCAFEVLNRVWTGLRVGLLINFKHAKLEWERIVL